MTADRRILLAVLTGAAMLFLIATRLRLGLLPDGDEPHYLAATQALARYGSLDPTPVYLHHDYLAYYPKPIEPHVVTGADGRSIPFHNPGGPLLWLLPFMLAGRAGAHLVMVLVSLLIVGNMFRLLRDLGIDRRFAGGVTALFVIGSPVYVYSSMLFVEPIGALLILYAVRVVLADRASSARLALASAGLGYLPWVHGRYAGFLIVLGGALAVRLVGRVGRRAVRPYLWGLLPMAVLAGGLEAVNLVRYGTLSPTPGYGTSEGVFELAPGRGLLFLALDGRFGILPNFPILVFALAGVLLAARRFGSPRVHLVLLGTIVPYAIIIATYPHWDGGYAPPGRLLAVVVPLLAYYVALALQLLRHAFATFGAALAGVAGFFLAFGSDLHADGRFHWRSDRVDIPIARIEATTGLPLSRFVPIAPPGTHLGSGQARVFAVWAVTVVVIVATLWFVGRRRPDPWAGLPADAVAPAG